MSDECSSSRLKFDDSVPVKEIRVEDPELAERDQDTVEFIGKEVTHRLAQRSSYVVLKYVRPVWRDKGQDEVHKATVPDGIIKRSFADVSFLAELADGDVTRCLGEMLLPPTSLSTAPEIDPESHRRSHIETERHRN